jgi:hypothetical protein
MLHGQYRLSWWKSEGLDRNWNDRPRNPRIIILGRHNTRRTWKRRSRKNRGGIIGGPIGATSGPRAVMLCSDDECAKKAQQEGHPNALREMYKGPNWGRIIFRNWKNFKGT